MTSIVFAGAGAWWWGRGGGVMVGAWWARRGVTVLQEDQGAN